MQFEERQVCTDPAIAGCDNLEDFAFVQDLVREAVPFRPWRIANRSALFAYVNSLGNESREWLLAFYVDADLNLLAVKTVACGSASDVEVDFGAILHYGRELSARGFVLVHNHPSGDAMPSKADIEVTRRMRHISTELNIPLLDHLIVAGAQMRPIGFW